VNTLIQRAVADTQSQTRIARWLVLREIESPGCQQRVSCLAAFSTRSFPASRTRQLAIHSGSLLAPATPSFPTSVWNLSIGPGGNDDGEVTIRFRNIGSAFGSSHRTRHVARCRLVTRFAFMVVRRNLFYSIVLRRDSSRRVDTILLFRQMEEAGIAPASRFSQADTQNDSYVEVPTNCLHTACSDLALRELVACSHRLSPDVRETIVRIARGRRGFSHIGE
jgi:hypothetical protein